MLVVWPALLAVLILATYFPHFLFSLTLAYKWLALQSLVPVLITTCVVSQALPPTSAQLKHFVWMVWDTCCLVCGGPPSANLFSRSPALIREIGNSYSAALAWLEQHVGVQADGVVVEDLSYDNDGAYTLPEGGKMVFHAFPNHEIGNLLEGDLYGLTCHMACYHFLHDKLNYKLQFEDVWPILALNFVSPFECLQNDYGGITKYHGQVSTKYLLKTHSHTSPI